MFPDKSSNNKRNEGGINVILASESAQRLMLILVSGANSLHLCFFQFTAGMFRATWLSAIYCDFLIHFQTIFGSFLGMFRCPMLYQSQRIRIFHIFTLCNPFQIFRTIIPLVPIFMVGNKFRCVGWANKGFDNQAVDPGISAHTITIQTNLKIAPISAFSRLQHPSWLRYASSDRGRQIAPHGPHVRYAIDVLVSPNRFPYFHYWNISHYVNDFNAYDVAVGTLCRRSLSCLH